MKRQITKAVSAHVMWTAKLKAPRSLSENSSLLLLNSLEKECKCVRIIWNHGETIPILPS